MTRYRIIKESTREPLSSWVDDRKHLDDHLAERPEWAQKELVQSSDDCPDYDPDTIYNLADLEFRYPDRIAMWEAQCGYIGDLRLLQSDIDNESRFVEFENAAEAAVALASAKQIDQIDPNLCRVCGSETTDFNLDYSEYWCHQCQRDYDEYGEPIDQEEEDDDD